MCILLVTEKIRGSCYKCVRKKSLLTKTSLKSGLKKFPQSFPFDVLLTVMMTHLAYSIHQMGHPRAIISQCWNILQYTAQKIDFYIFTHCESESERIILLAQSTLCVHSFVTFSYGLTPLEAPF